jgi:uncharacterized protein
MIKLLSRLINIKSPILRVGLFCLGLLLGCNKADNPDDVTIAFWSALAEYDVEQASYYSTTQSVHLFNESLRNASFQIGKVRYDCDGATVETQISRRSAAASSSFKTFLIRDQEQDRWKVDYPRTVVNIDRVTDNRFKNIVDTSKETGKAVQEKVQFKTFFKELWQAIKTVFSDLKERLLR